MYSNLSQWVLVTENTLQSLSLSLIKKKSPKYNSPVGNCEEANLVSRIPAPSINASRIPPMAAEPNMATGPSMDKPKALID